MEAALAEMTMDDLKDTEDDIDFVNERGSITVYDGVLILYVLHTQMKRTSSNPISRAQTKKLPRRTPQWVTQLYMMKKSKLARFAFIYFNSVLGSLNHYQAVRTRVERATAAAHARQKATFNPQAASPSKKTVSSDTKLKGRTSLGRAVDSQIIDVTKSGGKSKRQSQRKHTVLNTSATVTRMKNAETKRVRAIRTFRAFVAQFFVISGCRPEES
jgi:hypothetical protein